MIKPLNFIPPSSELQSLRIVWIDIKTRITDRRKLIDAPFAVPKAKRRNRAAFVRQEETCTPFLPLFRRYYRRISKIRPFRRFSHSLLHFGQQAADEISDRHKSRLSMTHPRENGRNPLFGRWKQSEYSSWNETLAIPS